ncbi:MAG: diguanylate cyclase [bacterium]|nr:MAG: diguanylate cyclase [bacterium]
MERNLEPDFVLPPVPRRNLWRRLLTRVGTLRFQILGIVIASVLVPSFLGGWMASARIDGILKGQVFRDIETRNERLAEQVQFWLESRSKDARDFALTSILLREEVQRIRDAAAPERVKEAVGNVQRYLGYILEGSSSFDAITILSSEGRPLASYPAGAPITSGKDTPRPPGTSPIVVEISQGGVNRLVVVQRLPSENVGDPALFLTRFREGLLGHTLTQLAPQDSVVYITDVEGRIKAANVEIDDDRQAPSGTQTLLREEARYSLYKGLQGDQVIAAAAPLPALGWKVLYETSRQAALQPLAAFRFQMLLMAIVLAIIFLLPAVLLARTVVLPLEELSRVARLIRSGKPGLQAKASSGGELGEFIGIFNSMSESLRQSMEEISTMNRRLHLASITDAMTGRYNRRYVEDYLNRALELAKRANHSVSVLMLDIDMFKKYNDKYGHIAGDEALRQLGNILVGSVRKTDVVARYGGEEWLVCLNHTGKKASMAIAEKIRKAIQDNTFQLKGQDTRITVSIGVATATEDGETYSEIVDAADTALYTAKESGRNLVRAFSADAGAGATPADRKES